MTIANPAALLLLLLLPFLVLLHLLRPVRRQINVSTLKFWRNAPAARRSAYSFAWRLLRSPSLWLQMLCVSVAAMALADPRLTLTDYGASRTVLIIDNSASTMAIEGDQSRHEAIKREAKKIVAALGPGQKAAVIATGIYPEVVASFSDESSDLQRALDGISPVAGAANVNAALSLASQLLRDEPPGNIHLVLDANVLISDLPENESQLHWHVIGSRHDNIGITGFDVRPIENLTSSYETFVALANAGDREAKFRLKLFIDDEKFYDTELVLKANGSRSYIVPFSHEGGGVLKAHIDVQDGFVIDNTVYAYLPKAERKKVLLVSNGNFFLEAALRSNKGLDVKSITPGLLNAAPLKFDIVVLDRISPEDIPWQEYPAANYLLIRSYSKNLPIKEMGEVDTPTGLSTDSSHPVGRHLDLSNTVIRRASKIEAAGDCAAPIRATQTPLVLACKSKIGRLVFVGFDFLQSEIPLRAALPILLDNALNWLSPVGLGDRRPFVRPNDRASIEFGRSFDSAVVTRPDGKTASVDVRNGRVTYDDTALPGIYSIDAGDRHAVFAVNMLDEAESNLGRIFEAPQNSPQDSKPVYTYTFQLWPILALLLVAIIVLELTYFLITERRRNPIPTILAALALGTLAISLFKPSMQVARNAGSVAFLVDVSDSIPAAKKAQAVDSAIAARNAKGADDNVQIITFAGRAAIADEAAADQDAIVRDREPDRTDIANAIRLALGKMPSGDARKIVLISDGNENFGDASRAARRASLRAATIHPVIINDIADGDVILESIEVPETAHKGETFNVRISVWSDSEQSASLTLDADAATVHSQNVRLVPGRNVFVLKDSTVKNRVRHYKAHVNAAQDGNITNDSAEAAIGVRGLPNVLILTNDLGRAENLANALQAQHFAVDTVSGTDAPSALQRLDDYATLILDNVPASNLSDTGMMAIKRYVSDDGGGLIMVGGDQSFGLGGYQGTPIEDILPVSMTPRGKIKVPSQAIVFVIDRSGSMSTQQAQRSRIDLAKQAAQEAIAMLADDTQVGVLTFDTEADWVVPIAPAKDKEAVQRSISTIDTGGGGTELLTALQEARRGLQEYEAAVKHIIVLSDGEAPEKHFKNLMEETSKDNITVSTIAISSEAGQELLRKIADWGGGRYYYTDDLYALPRILTTETRLVPNSGVSEKTFRPSVSRASNEILKGFDWAAAPALHGYVKTTLKPLAEPLLVSPRKDPVIAIGHSGIGRTAVYTSDFTGKWGKEWLQWPEFSKFVGQFVRWTNRATPQALKARLHIKNSEGTLVVEAIDPHGKFINFLDGEVGVVYPDQSRKVFALRQTGPGEYQSLFPATLDGLYLSAVSVRGSKNPEVNSAFAATFIPNAAENRKPTPNVSLMHHLANVTSGSILESARDIFPLKTQSLRWLAVWPWLILFAIALFMLQLIARWILLCREGKRLSNLLRDEGYEPHSQQIN